MDFKNADVAKGFVITGTEDQNVIIPGKYKGPLSEIADPAIVQGMIERKSNLVAPRAATAAAPASTSAKATGGAGDGK